MEFPLNPVEFPLIQWNFHRNPVEIPVELPFSNGKSAFYSTRIPVEFHQNSSGFQWNSTDFFSRGIAFFLSDLVENALDRFSCDAVIS